MSRFYQLTASVSLAALSAAAWSEDAPTKALGVVTVYGRAPSSLPTQIPTTMEGATREQVEATVNATDSEDALKYFPSLLVRKRYVGDYNHAVLSSRASGTGNSARSAVYADGILLSNYLGNGATYTPRWAMVTPEEIERVDVMYGPFSAAYPGNSVGAVVDYVTRMPARLEAHVKASYFIQPSFDLYNTHERFAGHQESASVGDRAGKFSWWLNLNHTWSHGQPLTFPAKAISTTPAAATDPVVTGAVLGLDRSNAPWYLLGTATEYTTVQNHAKLKLAYDFTPTLRASYLFGYWENDSTGRPQSYLRNAAGQPVYSGNVNVGGYRYALAATDFNVSKEALQHAMHGVSIKSTTQGRWDWEFAASVYDYGKDSLRTATVALPAANLGGAGTLTDQDGTGWNTLAVKGIWRPLGEQGAHLVDFGYQRESYTLRILKTNIDNWLNGAGGDMNTDVGGKTRLQSVYAQDVWAFAKKWKTVIGARIEEWRAAEGYTRSTAGRADYAQRRDTYVSPKAALAYQAADAIVLKASLGRAVRMPTVNELYGATTGVLTTVNDPNLKPEKSWTSELSYEQDWSRTLLRATAFYERVNDSLYSERTAVGGAVVTRIVNVGKIVTPGVEFSVIANDLFTAGLDLSGSLTFAASRIKENQGYVAVPGDTLGKYQPRVPVWRATVLLNYRFDERWNASYGLRYSGKQFSTLDNSDPNGFAYQGASRFLTGDLRVRYRFARQWTAALGVDNLNDYRYWNFHPYPQRTYAAELRWDL